LLASILFGGSATAAAAGSESVNYRCEPNKMADKVIALHAIITSISRLPATMDMMKGKEDDDDDKKMEDAEKQQVETTKSNRYLHITRAAMNGLKPLTAGALSAISIVTEARELNTTVQKMRAGNPCEKAQTLRTIKEEVKMLPETSDIGYQLTLVTSRRDASENNNESN
jgi:hypothetical protein